MLYHANLDGQHSAGGGGWRKESRFRVLCANVAKRDQSAEAQTGVGDVGEGVCFAGVLCWSARSAGLLCWRPGWLGCCAAVASNEKSERMLLLTRAHVLIGRPAQHSNTRAMSVKPAKRRTAPEDDAEPELFVPLHGDTSKEGEHEDASFIALTHDEEEPSTEQQKPGPGAQRPHRVSRMHARRTDVQSNHRKSPGPPCCSAHPALARKEPQEGVQAH